MLFGIHGTTAANFTACKISASTKGEKADILSKFLRRRHLKFLSVSGLILGGY